MNTSQLGLRARENIMSTEGFGFVKLGRSMSRSIIIAAFMGHFGATLLGLYFPLLLWRVAETGGGQAVALGSASILLGLLCLWSLRVRLLRKLGVGLVLCFLFFGGWFLRHASVVAPSGHIEPGNFSQHFSNELSFNPNHLANLVPEIDQLKMGASLFTALDPFIDEPQGARVQQLFLSIYHDLRQDPAFVEAGSVLGYCYEDLFLSRRKSLHYYTYVPRQLERTSYPVLFFLHGSLGNFKGYTWVLKELADTYGVAIVAPTYGAGNWYHDDSSSIMSRVWEACMQDPELNCQQAVLAGISNGGTGVTREIENHGKRYKGFLLISPVIEADVISRPFFISHAENKPFLLVHGEADRRIPFAAIERRAETLKQHGALLILRTYPEEDHFLLFSKREAVVKNVGTWLRGLGLAR